MLAYSRRIVVWGLTVFLVVVLIAAVFSQYFWQQPLENQLKIIQLRSDSSAKKLRLARDLVKASGGRFPEAQLYECKLLLTMGRNREARDVFGTISELRTCRPEELCRFAEVAQSHQESNLALRSLLVAEDFVLRDKRFLKLMIYVMYTLPNADEFEDRVLSLCRDYSQLAPDDAFPWLISSSLFHERGVPNLAMQAYREALKRDVPIDELARVQIQLIELELQMGELQAARKHCDELLSHPHDPASMKTAAALNADLLQREGKPAEAILILDKLLVANSDWARALGLRGRCKYDLMDLTGALTDLKEAVRLNRFDQQSHYVLGQVYRMLKDEVKSNEHLIRSRELTSIMAQILVLENRLRNDLYNPGLKLQLAELNEKCGDFDKAAAWRRGADKKPPSSVLNQE